MKRRLLCALLITAMCLGETVGVNAFAVSENSTSEIMEEGETTEDAEEVTAETINNQQLYPAADFPKYWPVGKVLTLQLRVSPNTSFTVALFDNANNRLTTYHNTTSDGTELVTKTITLDVSDRTAGDYVIKYWVGAEDALETGAVTQPYESPFYIRKSIEVAENKNITAVKIDNVAYTGQNAVPSVTITETVKEVEYNLVNGKDFTCEMTSVNKKDLGTVDLKITGIGDYMGTITGTFDIVPELPVITSVVSAGFNSAKISWTKSAHAEGYYIDRRDENGTFVNVGKVVGSSSLTYTDNSPGIVTGNTYYYRVRAYAVSKTDNTKEVTSIPNELGAAVVISPSAPKLVSLVSTSYNKFTLTWEAVAGANGYEVYRIESDGTLKLIKTTANTTYNITKDVICGKTYRYTVMAYVLAADGSTRIRSAYNTTGLKAKAKPATPVMISAKGTAYNQVTVKWKPVTKAYGYYIYRKEAGNADSEWTKVKTVKLGDTTSAIDKKAKTGVKYYYSVQAYTKVNGKVVKGEMNKKGLAAKAVPDKPKFTLAKWGADVDVNIQKVNGASGYMIYRSEGDGKFSKIATVSVNKSSNTTVYKDVNPGAGKTYQYYVKAYVTTDEKRVAGKASNKKSIKM